METAVDLIPLGLPGAGKGTAAKLAAKALHMPHVSTGDMLRALDRESELGREVFTLIDQGNFVPDEMIAAVVAERLSAPDARLGVLLDGFPRTLEQLPMYDGLSKRLGRRAAFVGLRVPEEVAVARLLARGEGRADDSPDVIKKRIEVYHQLTGPLVHELERQGRLTWVDGTLAPAQVGGFLVALREGYAHANQPEASERSVAVPLRSPSFDR